MSQLHYSKFRLNTYAKTPYFQAHIPEGYPLDLVLQKSRAFRRLPKNLKALAINAKLWAARNGYIDQMAADWYDEKNYELDPESGRRLTDAEIDADWDRTDLGPDVANLVVKDIPMPPNGFPTPDKWEVPDKPALQDAYKGLKKEQLLKDIATFGIEVAERSYGLRIPYRKPASETGLPFNEAVAKFASRRNKVLASDFFEGRDDGRRKLLEWVLPSVDTYDDLWGQAEKIFDRVEEYNFAKDYLADHEIQPLDAVNEELRDILYSPLENILGNVETASSNMIGPRDHDEIEERMTDRDRIEMKRDLR